MEKIINFLSQPWPWYVAGTIIGLSVPVLLLAGNKTLGISSSLRQLCAMCFPANIPFLKYNWKAQIWQFLFIGGLIAGGAIGEFILSNDQFTQLSSATITDLQKLGISYQKNILPIEIFSWENIFKLPNLLIIVGGGFLIGFGTRWSGGCTSGHGIFGLATFQWPSLVAVFTFFASGILTANFLLPIILKI